MFKLSFTADDFKRVVHTFIQAALGVLIVGIAAQSQIPKTVDDAKQVAFALGVAAVAAGLSAIKNALLADGAAIK
jgi:hypothetical protein